MNSMHHQQQLDSLVQRASEILKAPGKAVVLDTFVERELLKVARLESRTGLASGLPLIGFQGHGRGHRTIAGLECYRLTIGTHTIRFIKVFDQLSGAIERPTQDFCVVPLEHYVRFYRFLREKVRRNPGPEEPAPVLSEESKARLWDNSVGFLTRGRELLKQYDVPQKRGLLLMGEPGNGKTMACRWLRSQCYKQGLVWRYVRAEYYERARIEGDVQSVFDLEDPGVILFDDFDLGVRNREEYGATSHHSTFLGELDGVDAHNGVVYIFTTNARLSDLDPAFLRPGRIDQVVQFPRPDTDLRRRVILEHWHADIRRALDVEFMVKATDGLSFAELTEIKKLLVLHFLDSNRWDWDLAWKVFQTDARYAKSSKPVIGFARPNGRTRDLAAPDPMLNFGAGGNSDEDPPI
jgi:cell division protease FtsH